MEGLDFMSFGKILIALIIIVLGIYWMLDSLNIISPEMMSTFDDGLPYLAILFGILLLIVPLIHRKRPNIFFGLFFLIYGGLLLADQYGYLIFKWQDFWKLWPYLIIYFGLSMLFQRDYSIKFKKGYSNDKQRKKHIIFDWNTKGEGEKDTKRAFVNDAAYQKENWMAKPMNERVRIGSYTFDFTKAFIPDETIPIRLSGWVGDIKITMPDDLEFRVEVRAKVGDVKIDDAEQSGVLRNYSWQTAHYDQSVRKIDFTFDFQVIDLSIDQV